MVDKELIKEIYNYTQGTYGTERITLAINLLGYKINIKRVHRLKRFDAPTGPNDPCLCGSGKKIKNCTCGQWWRSS